MGVYTLGVYSLWQPILDLAPHTLGVHSGSLLWEPTGSGHQFWIWKTTLWESNLGVYWLGPPIWDLEDHTLGVYSGSLHSGSLLSRATDFGPGPVHTCLWESTLGVYFGGLHSGGLHSWRLHTPATDQYSPVLKKRYRGPSNVNVV